MGARMAWADLSDNYRKRLIAKGITPQQHAAGIPLKVARGHPTPAGIGEKAYANLRKLATGLEWRAGDKPKQVVDDLLAAGRSPRWIRERLQTRHADTTDWRTRHAQLMAQGLTWTQAARQISNEGNAPGVQHWRRRNLTIDMAWYWYH